MIIPNVGMVVLSVLASLSPSSKFKAGRSKNERYIIVCSWCFAKSCLSVWSIHARAYPLKDRMKACYQSRFLQGLPTSLKYHSGWKKWKLDIGDQIHTFSSREDALMAHKLVLEIEEKSSIKTVKQLNAELSAAGIKPERTKDKAVQAAVRLGFRQNDTLVCTCCVPKKAKDIPASHSCIGLSHFEYFALNFFFLKGSLHLWSYAFKRMCCRTNRDIDKFRASLVWNAQIKIKSWVMVSCFASVGRKKKGPFQRQRRGTCCFILVFEAFSFLASIPLTLQHPSLTPRRWYTRGFNCSETFSGQGWACAPGWYCAYTRVSTSIGNHFRRRIHGCLTEVLLIEL